MADSLNLSQDGQALMALIKSEFENLKSELRTELQAVYKEKFKLISVLQTEVTDLRGQVKKLQNDVDNANQYERKDVLILSGSSIPAVGEQTNEDCNALVCELVNRHLGVVIVPNDINTSHRLQPKKRSSASAGPIRTNIIVKLCKRDLKKRIILASKKGNRKDAVLYANESLTPQRRMIFNSLRRMKADKNTVVRGCSTVDGKIFAFTPPLPNQRMDQKHHISNLEALKVFCREYVKKPLDAFLDEFTN